MAIKLKNNNEINFEIKNSFDNKKKISMNIITFMLIAAISFGLMCFYPMVKRSAKKDQDGVYNSYDFTKRIYDASFVFYKDILEYEKGNKISIADAYINEFEIDSKDISEDSGVEEQEHNTEEYTDYSNKEEEKKNLIREIEDMYIRQRKAVEYNLKNLQYLVLDKGNNKVITNVENDLSKIEDVKSKYDFYSVITFDEEGYPEVLEAIGANKYDLLQHLSNCNENDLFNEGIVRAKLNPVKNCTFIYAVPKELKYNDYISELKERYIQEVDVVIIAAFVLTVFIIVLVLSFFVPYKKAEEIAGIKAIRKIPIEISIIMYWVLAISCAVVTVLGVQNTIDGNLLRILERLNFGESYTKTVIVILNMIMWSFSIYAIFSGAMLLKHIFKTGFVSYLKENLLIVKIYKFFARKVNKVKDELYHLDLRDKSNKVILKIIIINFVILSLISIIWFFGIGAAAIYSIVLFFVAVKYLDDLKEKFSKLIDATNKIAEGNLDAEINEDLGVFNPVKESILNIRKGFKNAVDEEVKSQRMKTELISNVSHDLKTPLTSIITYVDLLKNPDITEEERKSYIDTLDKKSQRLKFLIEDLFEVSKATSGNIKLNLVKVDIVELMRQTQIELQDKLNNSKLIIRNDYPNNKIMLNLDSQKTYRIFENLLNNVAKYAMENSRVYVNIIDNIDTVEITIKNMSANEINFTSDEIVERFQRGDKSRNTEGSGLGLAIAKSFVEAQGGSFNIEIDGDLFKVIILFKK